MSSKILLRRGTAAQWSSANPILGNGELGIETDTLKIKIGNGTSTWSQLTSYANVTPSELTSAINGIIDLSPSTLDTLNELAAAINDDPNFFTSVNTSLSDKASLTSANTFTNSPQQVNIASTSAVGLVVKAVSGQTANVLEVKDGASNNTFIINSANRMHQGNRAMFGADISYPASLSLGASASLTGFIIRGAASQTANLQEWQDSTGAILSYITASGALRVNSTFGGTQAAITAGSAATIGLIVRGAASQTANLQEWQNSSGTVLSWVNPSGGISLPRTSTIRFNGGTGVDRAYITSNTNNDMIFATAGGVESLRLYGGAQPNGALITSGNAPAVGLAIKAAASQTADLQQWQNSAGTVQARIASNGDFTNNGIFTVYGRFGGASFTDAAALRVNGYDTAVPTAVIKAIASQTANLTEWQNSNGNVIASVLSNGTFQDSATGFSAFGQFLFTSNQGMIARGTSATKFYYYANDTILEPLNAAYKGLIIKGAASQSANLQEWQNSDGSVLLNVDSTGSLDIGAGSNNIWKIKNQTSTVMEWQPGQGFCFFPYGSSNKPLTIKGTVSQSANLTEWRNSAETVIASISPTGKLTSAVDASINGMTIGLGGGNVNSNVAFGQGALASNVSGQNNTAIGYNALNSSTSYFNVAIGGSALQSLTTGGTNVALGVMAMRYATTADSAVAIGYSAAGSTTTGGYFVAIGAGALAANLTSGTDTVAIGYAALNQATATSATTAVGSGAGYALTTGIQNTYLGRVADGVTTGSNNMMLGYSATASSATVSNEITLGNSSITRFRIPGIGLNITSNSTINPVSASTVGLIIKAAASQTANLTEWQISDGTVRARISPDGHIIGSTRSAFGTSAIISGVVVAAVADAATAIPLVAKGATSQTAALQQWQDSAGTVKAFIRSDGFLRADSNLQTPTIYGPSGTGGTQANIATAWTFTTNVATNVGIIIKAAASQSANLQEWQDNSGSVLSKIDYRGWLILPASNRFVLGGGIGDFAETGAYLLTGSSNITIGTRSASNKGLVVQGVASQTANLQEWQDSNGTVYAFINPYGQLSIGQSPTIYSNARISLNTVATTVVGMVIRGVASQTANLQEWQDSTGAVIAKLDPAGGFTTGTPSTTNIKLDATAAGAKLHFGTPATFNNYATLGAYSSVFNIEANARSILATVTNSTTTTTLIVKANTSQTANLTEWQNSAGTILANITASGSLELNGKDIELMNIMGAF